jgi:opacity protein-like surface antigen
MRRLDRSCFALAGALVVCATTAAAQPVALETPSQPRELDSGILVGAKLGGIIPFNGLSPFVSFGVEVGYAMSNGLAFALDIDYTAPTKTGSEMDPRVTGGTYTWKLTEQELGIMPVVVYRLAGKSITPFGGIGPRLLLAKSTVQSDTGNPTILPTHEQSTRIGIGIPVGAEIAAGPGKAIAELLLQYGTLNHAATGDASTGAATLSIGYRFTF